MVRKQPNWLNMSWDQKGVREDLFRARSAARIGRHQAALRALDARAEAGHQLAPVVSEVERFTDLRGSEGRNGCAIRMELHAAREGALHGQV